MNLVLVGAEAWDSDLSGDIQFSDGSSSGSKIDLGDDLDVEDEDVLVYRGALKAGPLVVDLKYLEANFEGRTTLTQTIEFDGVTFNVNSDVDSDLDVLMAAGYLKLPFFKLPTTRVAAVLGVNYIDVEAELVSTSPVQLQVSDDIQIPVPVIGIAVATEIPLPGPVAIFGEAELAGLVVDEYEDIDGKFIDGSLSAGVRYDEWLRFGLGFRVFEVDFDDDSGDNEANLDLAGGVLFLEIVF